MVEHQTRLLPSQRIREKFIIPLLLTHLVNMLPPSSLALVPVTARNRVIGGLR